MTCTFIGSCCPFLSLGRQPHLVAKYNIFFLILRNYLSRTLANGIYYHLRMCMMWMFSIQIADVLHYFSCACYNLKDVEECIHLEVVLSWAFSTKVVPVLRQSQTPKVEEVFQQLTLRKNFSSEPGKLVLIQPPKLCWARCHGKKMVEWGARYRMIMTRENIEKAHCSGRNQVAR